MASMAMLVITSYDSSEIPWSEIRSSTGSCFWFTSCSPVLMLRLFHEDIFGVSSIGPHSMAILWANHLIPHFHCTKLIPGTPHLALGLSNAGPPDFKGGHQIMGRWLSIYFLWCFCFPNFFRQPPYVRGFIVYAIYIYIYIYIHRNIHGFFVAFHSCFRLIFKWLDDSQSFHWKLSWDLWVLLCHAGRRIKTFRNLHQNFINILRCSARRLWRFFWWEVVAWGRVTKDCEKNR